MIKPTIVTLSQTLQETHHTYQIYASEIAEINKHKTEFQNAIRVVDAQFYYTNPLLFFCVRDISNVDLSDWGQLWGAYYLVNITDIEEVLFKEEIFAVNERFLEQIGNLDTVMEDENFSFLALHEKHGLYVVAILQQKT